MSQLPAGTKAAAAFAESAIVYGMKTAALSAFPALFGLPIIGSLATMVLEKVVGAYLAHPGVSETTKYALAGAWATDRGAFDKRFIYFKTLDKQNLPPEVLEKELQLAEKDMEKFIRRGPVT